MTRAGRGGGGGGGGRSASTGLILPTNGEFVDEEIQAAIDAAADNEVVRIGTEGTLLLEKPLRMLNKVTLQGMGPLTLLASHRGGPMVYGGAHRPLPPHGDPILDDADYSYVMNGAVDYILNCTLHGARTPTAGAEFWFEAAVVFTAPMVSASTRIVEIGGEIFQATGYTESFRIAPEGGFLKKLNVQLRVGGVLHLLNTTTEFDADIGTRHMIAVGLKNNVMYLFVDGVIEATVATSGTFDPPFYESLVVGGAIFSGFPQGEIVAGPLPFNLGSMLVKRECRYTTNYTVDWTEQAPLAADICSIWCTDEREWRDLIKLGLAGNDYAWLQADNNNSVPDFTEGVGIWDLSFGHGGGIAAQATGVHMHACDRSSIRRVRFTTGCATVGIGNNFYSTLEDITHQGNGRVGIAWSGGVMQGDGLLKSVGAKIGAALWGGGLIDRIHVYDYSFIGILCDQFAGVIANAGVSDEGLAIGTDPLYNVYIKRAVGQPSNLIFLSLGLDVTTSDTTIPIGIEGVLQEVSIHVNGIMPGLTTPPAELVHFTDPDDTDPVFIQHHGHLGIPLSLDRHKILTPDGPLGALTLTDADRTVTALDAHEFDYLGVTLTANRVLTLDDADDPADGVCIRVRGNPTFGGFTLTVKNHDATTLHTFSAAGSAVLRFSAATGDWSEV
jgi:hypothetical protein